MKKLILNILFVLCSLFSFAQQQFDVQGHSTTGSDTYTVSITNLTSYEVGSSPVRGVGFSIIFDTSSSGACSLNVNGLGAKTINGDITAGVVYRLEYNVVTDEFDIISGTGGGTVSLGTEGQIPVMNSTDDDFVYSDKFKWDDTDNRLIAGNGTISSGTNNINLGDNTTLSGSWSLTSAEESTIRGNNNISSGWDVTVGDGSSSSSGNGTITSGIDNINYGIGSYVGGIGGQISYVSTSQRGGFVHAFSAGSIDGKKPSGVEYLIANDGAFNVSRNTANQTAGHGALAQDAAILGGINHNIPSTSPRSVIIGGDSIKARGSDPDNVYVPYLNIGKISQDDTLTQIVARNRDTNKLYWRDASTLGGGGSGTVNSGLANRLAYYSSSGTTVDDLAAITANRAIVSDANGLPVHATTTDTEIGYVNGVTSSIQTQINTKAPTASPAFTGNPTAPTPSVSDDDTSIATTEFVKDNALPAATSSNDGYLTSTDWSTFNNKQISLTQNVSNTLASGGTWTATGNNQYHMDWGGQFTARSTTSDNLIGFKDTYTLIAGGSTQDLIGKQWTPTFNVNSQSSIDLVGLDYNPTITGTPATHVSAKFRSGTFLIGTGTLQSGITGLQVNGTGTTSGIPFAVYNGTPSLKFYVQDNGISNHVATFTTTATGQSGVGIGGTITGRASNPDRFFTFMNSAGLTMGANSQTGVAYGYTGAMGDAASTGTTGIGFLFEPASTTGVDKIVAFQSSTGQLVFDADLTPAQITSNTDDYAPTGIANALTLRLSTDASRNLTSVTGGADGRFLFIFNVGTQNIVIKDDDGATGTAANRFALSADVTLTPDDSMMFIYDGTSSRWRRIGL